ncbi:anti-sigma-28 factor, FlgM family [Thiocystis violascens DSM 198]|uniref:Negative regulator of flagellin synthesis n=2 Tax=Thiocystis violascens TaxID=73141 RepID=I3Y641_THIV6|nr:anti-sigma-28 factor, FlgM family [Thiocystis violascens DSM 198]
MDIKNLTGGNLRTEGSPSGVKPRVTSTADRPSTPNTPGAIGEPVTLTQTARIMSAARDQANNVPINEAKVAELTVAIAEGRYSIDNQRLADRMLAFERLLA